MPPRLRVTFDPASSRIVVEHGQPSAEVARVLSNGTAVMHQDPPNAVTALEFGPIPLGGSVITVEIGDVASTPTPQPIQQPAAQTPPTPAAAPNQPQGQPTTAGQPPAQEPAAQPQPAQPQPAQPPSQPGAAWPNQPAQPAPQPAPQNQPGQAGQPAQPAQQPAQGYVDPSQTEQANLLREP